MERLKYVRVAPTQLSAVVNGSSDRAFYPDSYTIDEDDLQVGEAAELGVKITVDVWRDGASIGAWTVSEQVYYYPPRNE